MAVVFAGGGSGGHLFPGLAVAEELARRLPAESLHFIGSRRSIEQTILSGTPYPHHPLEMLPSTALRRQPFRFAWKTAAAIRAASRLLRKCRTRVVIGLGGFASLPVVYAASWQRVPVVLLEQNVIPGRATAWLSRRATVICTSFPETAAHLPGAVRDRVICTGNPVRQSVAKLVRSAAPVSPQLLILGGSQGANALNEIAARLLEELIPQWQGWRLVHQVGSGQQAALEARYRDAGLTVLVREFIHDLPALLAETTLVISRAGATTLAELACAGIPALLIPDPLALRDHQRQNAEIYRQAGAALAWQLADFNETVQLALPPLRAWLQSPELLGRAGQGMRTLARPDAAQQVADVCARWLE